MPSLDAILRQVDASAPTDSRVERLLTQSLFVLIRDLLDRQSNFVAIFKAAAICVKLNLSINEILGILGELSENHANDQWFTVANLHEKLCALAFTNKPGVSRLAAGILRRICGNGEIAQSLIQNGILGRFAVVLKPEQLMPAIGPPPTHFVRLLIPLIQQIPDFRDFGRSEILKLLLKLVVAYPGNEELHHTLANAIAQILDRADSEEVLGQFELADFFALFDSRMPEVVQSAAIGLTTALEKSERIRRGLAGMQPPSGVARLCAAMRGGTLACRAALMACVKKLAEGPAGMDVVGGHLEEIVEIIGLPIDDMGVWSIGQSFLLNGLAILQKAASKNPKAVAAVLTGKIAPLLVASMIDHTIDLVRMLGSCPGAAALQSAVKTAGEAV
jgi:hypothetical protein